MTIWLAGSNNKRGRRLYLFPSRLPATLHMMFLMVLSFIFFSCSDDKKQVNDEADILLMAEGETLTIDDVLLKISPGINPNDSLALFHEIVENWVRQKVLSKFAEQRLPDLERIEHKVNEYRNRLIVNEYIYRMRNSGNFSSKLNADSVKAYYIANKNDFISHEPLVMGIIVKLPESSVYGDEIKLALAENNDDNIDRIEKDLLGDAFQYDYFGNRWVGWQVIADMIPYRFGDPDSFLAENKDFDTVYKGVRYILHVSEYLPTGTIKPFEYAKVEIEDIMIMHNISDYEEELVNNLIKKALEENKLKEIGYDIMHKETISTR